MLFRSPRFPQARLPSHGPVRGIWSKPIPCRRPIGVRRPARPIPKPCRRRAHDSIEFVSERPYCVYFERKYRMESTVGTGYGLVAPTTGPQVPPLRDVTDSSVPVKVMTGAPLASRPRLIVGTPVTTEALSAGPTPIGAKALSVVRMNLSK